MQRHHAKPLHAAFIDAPDSLWTYMSFGPFRDRDGFAAALETMIEDPTLLPYVAVVDDVPAGFASYLRIQASEGVIEIGSITFSPRLQHTTAATESLHLMIRNVFALGYRRCEWKCDALNAASRSAAVRLGFTHEGTFSQATHYKGRNRDTAWYAITDKEWPALDIAFQRWLASDNFDDEGRQRRRLEEMMEKT